jgi:dynein heavy chain
LVKLEFQEVDILAMYSNEGEKVNFSKPLKARGQVEQWLESVQVGMKDTLYRLMKQGLGDYATQDRKHWVLNHFGKIVATIAQIQWSSQTKLSLQSMKWPPILLPFKNGMRLTRLS